MSVSIQCEKEFTLTVQEGIPTPNAYWTMDEAVGDRIDQIHGLPLATIQGIVPAVPGKINNAAQMTALGAGFPFMVINASDTDLIPLAYVGTGFTICGWVNGGGIGSGSGSICHLFFQDILDNDIGDINLKFAGFSGPGTQSISFIGHDDGGLFFSGNIDAPQGAWWFYRLWFDPFLGTIQLQINNTGGIALSGPGRSFSLSHHGIISMSNQNAFPFVTELDELGIWLKVLTDNQVTLLYNAGAGKTCCPFT
jgi:hypothetical protein